MWRRQLGFSDTAAAAGFLRLAWIAGWIAVGARSEDFTLFEQAIRPVLAEQCYGCHSAQAGPVKGGLRLDTREGVRRGGISGQSAVVPGHPEKSRLLEAIRSTNHEAPIPPKIRLNERQIADFITWIQEGAPDPRGDAVVAAPGSGAPHWAFQAVRRPGLPAVNAPRWVQSSVDAFILASLEAKGLSPAPPAARRTLLRRASYDLTGLPPTPAEIEAFENDPSPDAFTQVVERLLASPAYGERWGRHWLDVVRYADARDLIQLPVESDFREAWRYRDWVVDAHNRDLPYAEFIRRQIAGDLLQPSDPEQLDADALVATGFLAIADFVPGDVDKEQMIADYVNDQMDVMGRAFLGLTLGCARCHDHKFDPVTLRDYYAMAGIFFSTRLIPSPVLGNTPLVKVPLLPQAALTRIEAWKKRAAKLDEQTRKLQADAELEYLSALERLATEETARYLMATWKFQHQAATSTAMTVGNFARSLNLAPKILAQWLDYFGLREYPPCVSLATHQDGVAGLVRWTSGTNSLPVARINTRSESVEHLGVQYPPGSVSLAPSKASGLVLSWTSPLLGTVRWSGHLTAVKAAGSKGITAALDLRTAAGRRELAAYSVADGSAVDLEKSPGRIGSGVAVRPGDRLEFVVSAPSDSKPTGLLDWTITEVDGPRSWSAGRDLVRAREMSSPKTSLPKPDPFAAAWRIRETGDVRRRAGEPAAGSGTWVSWRQCLAEAATRAADLMKAQQVAHETEAALAGLRRQQTAELDAAPSGTPDLLRGELLKLQSTDPRLRMGGDGRVAVWPNRARSLARFASVAGGATGPWRTNATIDGLQRPVLRFTGNELMDLPLAAPAAGSLFAVFRTADLAAGGQRLVGWEDADTGRHGLGLMLTAGGGLHAILRKEGANGDIVAPPATNRPFEIVCITWGSQGATFFRQGVAVGKSRTLDGISSDPQIKALRLGGPGSGAGGRFQGDLAELRVYAQPLGDDDRGRVEQELREAWINPTGSPTPISSAWALVYDDLCSPQGPYWLSEGEREEWVPSSVAPQLREARAERERVLNSIPTNIPQAVVVQEGGPNSTKHEGFKDASVYLRGNPATPGAIVPRGFPRFLAGDHQTPITSGSGRRQLADWIADASNPLTFRVAVNRIWQHHFGQGIVRTSTNFGRRGERPTHPELLDYLATRFVESGGSMKAMHRIIMLSSTYQQRSDPEPRTLSADPENLLVGRMNRSSLDAESLRDSLLVAAGRLDRYPGGMGFQDVSLPRRSLYLMSVRTGAKSGFASVFDGPDGSAVVERRTVSTVAPQALFLLNDPFTIDQASALARRIAHESTASAPEAQIWAAYRWVFGRAPTEDELAIGRELLQPGGSVDPLDRFCQLLLCSNEFFYLD